jgi:6-carboxyhexanoate--CoA ligase
MKASKNRGQKARTGQGLHISGAEGIFCEDEITRASEGYILRAITHPRGTPDTIVITLEAIKTSLSRAPLLTVSTAACKSPEEGWGIMVRHLALLGISAAARNAALKVLRSKKTMRGASLIAAVSGRRLEISRERGVRVSHLGIDRASEKKLCKRLVSMKIDTTTVKEALVLASKVVSCSDVIAEICISDDPDYTTGYLASRETGYLRVPNMKCKGEMHGGRVFFLRTGANINKTIEYLEKKPVIMETRAK